MEERLIEEEKKKGGGGGHGEGRMSGGGAGGGEGGFEGRRGGSGEGEDKGSEDKNGEGVDLNKTLCILTHLLIRKEHTGHTTCINISMESVYSSVFYLVYMCIQKRIINKVGK